MWVIESVTERLLLVDGLDFSDDKMLVGRTFSYSDTQRLQGQDFGSASKDLFTAIERGDYPQWDFYVQIMEDHEHPELDWDPLP
jgi:catalase